ncbi:PREDICTED: uncharacterized protein LOC109346951 [Lupinus angustifolius]|uniref:uncharacterized protein LOC109346951 n=1 Tax=Lupinus angustifolius TaxID=3871 RepID=UPI00092E840A|nr:PREDICTED: uncharacterized protein LOC109346951 [Lupinus angustifolius]
MIDSCTDKKNRTILNFLVYNPKGTVFLKAFDASHIAKTANIIFKMINDVVEEIGEDNVVQVVTNNASNYKVIGEMLVEKRKKLYWTSSIAHYIDVILEEFENKIIIHADIIYKAWKATKFVRTRNRRLIEDVVLDKEFWRSIVFVLDGAFLLMKVLRLVDSDDYEKPSMRLVYETMDQAKEKIQSVYNNVEDRWDRQLHRPLHVATYFLNPQLHYALEFTVDLEVRNELFDVIGRMMPDIQDQSKIALQMDRLTNKRSFFGKNLALNTMNQKTPTDWWEFFRDETPELNRFALHKQASKGVELTIDDISSDDEWIVEHNNDDDDHLNGPYGDGDDLMREILGEDNE